jgi:hypothetical protein
MLAVSAARQIRLVTFIIVTLNIRWRKTMVLSTFRLMVKENGNSAAVPHFIVHTRQSITTESAKGLIGREWRIQQFKGSRVRRRSTPDLNP